MEESPIIMIPAVKLLSLVDVGPWQSATFEFSPNINLLRGPSGCGKSFVLRALLPVAHPSLTTRTGSTGGTVAVTYARPEFHYGVSAVQTIADLPALSVGQRTVRLLGEALRRATPHCCLCCESGVMFCLDARHRAQAIALINQAPCQFIIVLPTTVTTDGFHPRKVFECVCDPLGRSPSVIVTEGRA